ncbi:GNAT family N-acetyltransferase [Streptomyces jumonjinensis]|uniref:GNAT family N-acetyltransferase n=1 Tax=Streptomyces jumonjinensis TaxID=1945 RepID=A0A646K941_STRJU|nr:GNAT family N-acetyltransferase [Streptomyces jumonjinensis]
MDGDHPVKGLLCRILPVSEESLGTVAKWLSATECETLLRGTSSRLVRESQYASMENEHNRAALIADSHGNVVGLAHFWRLGEGVYEIGGAVGDAKLWRTGIGLEAAMLLFDYLFEVLNCQRVQVTTGVHNEATVKLGLADDMSFEAVCRDYLQTPEGTVPVLMSSLTRAEFYQPYPHYQPRVGRRIDRERLSALNRNLAQRIDMRAIAGRLGGEQ